MATAEELASQTVRELRSLASKHKIPGRTRMKKHELVAALAAVLADPVEPIAAPVELVGASSPGSSIAAAPAAPREASKEPEAGLPIPDAYGQDRLTLMAQDPHHLFAYWELTGPARERAYQAAGDNATPVIILHTAGGSEQRSIDLAGGNYYLSVAAGSSYRAELALRTTDGRLIVLVGSDEITTPAASPSDSIDESWMAVDGSFEELLVQAGLPGGIGSSASIADQRVRSRMWHALVSVSAPMGSSDLPSSHSFSSHSLVG